jgi:hypothetical protein
MVKLRRGLLLGPLVGPTRGRRNGTAGLSRFLLFSSPTELRELLYFLVDTVLDRQPPPSPGPEALPVVQLSTR